MNVDGCSKNGDIFIYNTLKRFNAQIPIFIKKLDIAAKKLKIKPFVILTFLKTLFKIQSL
jgi:hypothetical protein